MGPVTMAALRAAFTRYGHLAVRVLNRLAPAEHHPSSATTGLQPNPRTIPEGKGGTPVTEPDKTCPRCSGETEQPYIEIQQLCRATPDRVPVGPLECRTDGCVGDDGTNRIIPPPTAEQMRRQIDDEFLARHRRLAGDAS